MEEDEQFPDFMTQDEAEELNTKIKRSLSDVFTNTYVKKEYKVNSQYGWHVFGMCNSGLEFKKFTKLIKFAEDEKIEFMIFNGNLVKFI